MKTLIEAAKQNNKLELVVINGRPTVDQFMAYENGEMEHDDVIHFFQQLIDTGMAWTLQGSYGRTAASLIEGGYCEN